MGRPWASWLAGQAELASPWPPRRGGARGLRKYKSSTLKKSYTISVNEKAISIFTFEVLDQLSDGCPIVRIVHIIFIGRRITKQVTCFIFLSKMLRSSSCLSLISFPLLFVDE